MKPLSLLIMVSFYSAAIAQQSEAGMQLDSLISKLHQVIDFQKSIETEEIKGVYRITPWHFVPSLNYDFINNRYYLTVSSGPLVTNMINKRQEARRLSAIDRRYTNQIKSSEIKLKSLYVSTIHHMTNIQLSYEILMNDIDIFKIKQEEHASNEIDTETFLRDKSSILNKIKSHNTEVANTEKYLLDIQLLTEEFIDLDFMQYYVSPAIILSSLNPLNSSIP